MSGKRAWIYCRIDAPEDAHGVLKGQYKKLEDYASQMGFTVVGSSHDLGIGLPRNRSGFKILMEAAQDGGFDVLVIDSVSRISRDARQVLEVLDEWDGYSIRIYSPLEGEINREPHQARHVLG